MKQVGVDSWLTTTDSTFQYAVVFMICLLDGADMALVASTMKSLEESLGLTPLMLGLMAFAQAFTMALAGPWWGWLCDTGRAPRSILMAGGMLGWGFMMFFTAVSVHPGMFVVARFLNGIFLASLMPLTQSWVADHSLPERRGIVFGYLSAAQALGNTLCTSVTVAVASEQFCGIAGWRICSFAVGVASVAGSCLVYKFMGDGRVLRSSAQQLSVLHFGEVCQSLRRHWKIPTFRVIIAQGVVGSIPWRAMGFEMMFLLYVGFDPATLSVLNIATAPVRIVGGLVGGYVGDWAAWCSPYHGRAWTAMISVAAGIPCAIMMVKTLPETVGPSLLWYIVWKHIFSLTATWCLTGVNRPILNDVVDPKCRASIIAWDSAIEGMVSSIIGMPFLGYMSQACFGYTPTRLTVQEMPSDLRAHNLRALQSSLMVMYITPWAICFCFFAGLHWTYKGDVQRIAKETEKEVGEANETTLLCGAPNA